MAKENIIVGGGFSGILAAFGAIIAGLPANAEHLLRTAVRGVDNSHGQFRYGRRQASWAGAAGLYL